MTDAEAPLLWPHDAKSWLTGKDPDTGKDRGQKKGTTEDEMVGWHHWLSGQVWVNSGSGWWTGRPGVLRSMGSPIVGQGWATEQQWERYLTKLRISIKKNQKLGERTNRIDYIESVTKESKNWLGGLTAGIPSTEGISGNEERSSESTQPEVQKEKRRKRREVQRSVRKH